MKNREGKLWSQFNHFCYFFQTFLFSVRFTENFLLLKSQKEVSIQIQLLIRIQLNRKVKINQWKITLFFKRYSKRRLQRSFKKSKNRRPISFINKSKVKFNIKRRFFKKKTGFNYKNWIYQIRIQTHQLQNEFKKIKYL